jgi:integrase
VDLAPRHGDAPLFLNVAESKLFDDTVIGDSDSYVDQETGAAKAVINKAFDNDLVSGETVKVFKRVKKLLKRNANARDKILTLDQFDSLMENLPRHTKAILSTAFYTGMRRGEILSLTWDKVDMESRFIRLEAADTKDKEPRSVPICDELFAILRTVPRALHDEVILPGKCLIGTIPSTMKTKRRLSDNFRAS